MNLLRLVFYPILLVLTVPIVVVKMFRGRRTITGIEPMVLDVLITSDGPIGFEMLAMAFERQEGREVRGVRGVRIKGRDVRLSLDNTIALGLAEEIEVPDFLRNRSETAVRVTDEGRDWFQRLYPERAAEIDQALIAFRSKEENPETAQDALRILSFSEAIYDPEQAAEATRTYEKSR